MAENENRYEILLAAFVAGGLLGAGLAILFAPGPGEENREKLSILLRGLKENGGGTPQAPPGKEAGGPAAHPPPPVRAKLNKLAEEIRRRKERLFGKGDPD